MYHISANLALGRREKNIWGTKSSRGRQIGYKRTPKKWQPFLDIKFLCMAPKKLTAGGVPDGNVPPLLNAKHLWVKLYLVQKLKGGYSTYEDF